MKNYILLIGALITSATAFGGTDIVYGEKAGNYETVSAGNIQFPTIGLMDARDVCFDQVNRVYKTTIPSHNLESCSIKDLPLTMCTENGGVIIETPIAAQNLTAPEYITVQKCLKYDYQEYKSPVCVEFVNLEKQQPVDYTFMKYQVEFYEGDNASPKIHEERNMKVCE